jgi:hypothetical protein
MIIYDLDPTSSLFVHQILYTDVTSRFRDLDKETNLGLF